MSFISPACRCLNDRVEDGIDQADAHERDDGGKRGHQTVRGWLRKISARTGLASSGTGVVSSSSLWSGVLLRHSGGTEHSGCRGDLSRVVAAVRAARGGGGQSSSARRTVARSAAVRVVAVPAGILHGGAAIVGDVDEDGAAVVGVGSAVNESSRIMPSTSAVAVGMRMPSRCANSPIGSGPWNISVESAGPCRAHLSHRARRRRAR